MNMFNRLLSFIQKVKATIFQRINPYNPSKTEFFLKIKDVEITSPYSEDFIIWDSQKKVWLHYKEFLLWDNQRKAWTNQGFFVTGDPNDTLNEGLNG